MAVLFMVRNVAVLFTTNKAILQCTCFASAGQIFHGPYLCFNAYANIKRSIPNLPQMSGVSCWLALEGRENE